MRVGLLARGGRAGARVTALGRDVKAGARWTPLGIPRPRQGALSLYLARSALTRDVTVDVLELWGRGVRGRFPRVRKRLVNRGNGPGNSRRRTRPVKRLAGFAPASGVEVRLAGYPPCHGQSNPIARCRGALGRPWGGAVLDGIPTAPRLARSMTWKGKHPMAGLVDRA